ncbi:MAG: flavodoxin family protein [Candidatus Saccharibacteria bacterium]
MKVLIVVDSQFGNSRQIAEAMKAALPDCTLLMAKDAQASDLAGVEMLLVGSPTQGGRPTQAALSFLSRLPDLKGIKAAAFDTRMDTGKMNFVWRIFLKLIGFASEKISGLLRDKGSILAPPEGFLVEGKEGPLKSGELERAKAWVATLIQ